MPGREKGRCLFYFSLVYSYKELGFGWLNCFCEKELPEQVSILGRQRAPKVRARTLQELGASGVPKIQTGWRVTLPTCLSLCDTLLALIGTHHCLSTCALHWNNQTGHDRYHVCPKGTAVTLQGHRASKEAGLGPDLDD